MRKVKLEKGDYLVVDECYIPNKDGLRVVKTFNVDDGDRIMLADGRFTGAGVGVDSGNITIYRAERTLEVESDSGLSGELVLANNAPIDRISFR